ncbi:MAG: hypothetical protein KC502_05475 [Myxococcales bacterium]|nr:hypothetical protein [Myxococcales bacterium]
MWIDLWTDLRTATDFDRFGAELAIVSLRGSDCFFDLQQGFVSSGNHRS